MLLVALGAILLGLKLAGIWPVADWSWILVLLPFPFALGWWWFSDASGRTSRVQTDKDLQRKEERRRNRNPGLRFLNRFDRAARDRQRAAEARELASRQRLIDKIEGEREKRRQANRESILTTRIGNREDSRWTSSQGDAARASKPDR
ncbi:MAG: TIGR04438 family Trp-rich protein [Burkholderiaceae bacterium]|jgi:small Trp-rich protein|nr:TIGR04438 family Trp-rich protein [Burkholderiaceae bacterium]